MAERGHVRPDIRGMAGRGEFKELIEALRGSNRDTVCSILDALVGAGEAAVPAPFSRLLKTRITGSTWSPP